MKPNVLRCAHPCRISYRTGTKLYEQIRSKTPVNDEVSQRQLPALNTSRNKDFISEKASSVCYGIAPVWSVWPPYTSLTPRHTVPSKSPLLCPTSSDPEAVQNGDVAHDEHPPGYAQSAP
ncbi:hypothetical protein M8818_000125 [Zalaria obscura]|uniref:Uncharacterized protein n=1 Tax=Zalaria obscura TaxID=2024903 RepID=A0ACC3SNP1_9PEZI